MSSDFTRILNDKNPDPNQVKDIFKLIIDELKQCAKKGKLKNSAKFTECGDDFIKQCEYIQSHCRSIASGNSLLK